jgi:hypothetical protein
MNLLNALKGRVIQTSLKGICTEWSKKKEQNSQEHIRKIVSNMHAKALSSFKELSITLSTKGEKIQA